jgi:Family of unknown function (DUF6131)
MPRRRGCGRSDRQLLSTSDDCRSAGPIRQPRGRRGRAPRLPQIVRTSSPLEVGVDFASAGELARPSSLTSPVLVVLKPEGLSRRAYVLIRTYGSEPAGIRVELTSACLSTPRLASIDGQEERMIILGIILLVIGFIANVAILWSIGIILLLVGLVLVVLGSMGRAVGGRRHYY